MKIFSKYQIHFISADSQLFLRLDAAELLTWVKEQSEEKSLNLTKFTEHFNNMSFWTRTLILQQTEAKVDLNLYKTKNKIETVFFSGKREISSKVYQNYEMASKNEQF